MKQQSRPGWTTNLILLTVSVGITLAAAEAALQVMWPEKQRPDRPQSWAIVPEQSWITYDVRLGWWHEASKKAFLEKGGSRIPVTVNSAGFRGTREYSREKPPGVFRILAAGDSFTFGFGVPDHESFPAVMESSSASLEVLNMGVPGYGVDQIYLSVIEKGMPYKPDMVLLVIYPEDFWRATRAFSDAGYGKPYFVRTGEGLDLRHVPVPRQKDFSVAQFPETRDRDGIMNLLENSRVYHLFRRAWQKGLKVLGLEDPDTTRSWLLGREILAMAARDLEKRGIPLVIVLAPPQRWVTGTDEPVRESLLRFGERHDIPVLDLTPAFLKAVKSRPAGELYIPGDYHWTAAGNRLAAAEILEFIEPWTEALRGQEDRNGS